MLDTIKAMMGVTEQSDAQDESMIHIEYPQPFCQIVDGYERDEVSELKQVLEARRKELKERLEYMDPDEDGFVRARDKMGWLWRKMIYCDQRLSAFRREAKHREMVETQDRIQKQADRLSREKEEKRKAHEALLASQRELKKSKDPKPQNEPIVAMLVWHTTDRNGEQFSITDSGCETSEWFVKQVENLSPEDSDLVPKEIRFRSLTKSQLDRIPAWLKSKVKQTH